MKLPRYELLKITAQDIGTLKAEWMGEVVTCGDCKFYREETSMAGIVFRECHCDQWYHPEAPYPAVRPDDFCSFGQRRMTEEEEWQER